MIFIPFKMGPPQSNNHGVNMGFLGQHYFSQLRECPGLNWKYIDSTYLSCLSWWHRFYHPPGFAEKIDYLDLRVCLVLGKSKENLIPKCWFHGDLRKFGAWNFVKKYDPQIMIWWFFESHGIQRTIKNQLIQGYGQTSHVPNKQSNVDPGNPCWPHGCLIGGKPHFKGDENQSFVGVPPLIITRGLLIRGWHYIGWLSPTVSCLATTTHNSPTLLGAFHESILEAKWYNPTSYKAISKSVSK